MSELDVTQAIPVDDEAEALALRKQIAALYVRRDALLNKIADEHGEAAALRAFQAIQDLSAWDGGRPAGMVGQ